MRFFAGFYFLYRLIALADFLFSRTLFEFYSTLEIILVSILALHAVVQPHKKRMHNVVDVLLFADLAAINAFTLLLYYNVVLRRKTYASHFALLSCIQTILIYLPLVCLLVVSLVKAWKLFPAYCKSCNSETQRLLEPNVLPLLRGE